MRVQLSLNDLIKIEKMQLAFVAFVLSALTFAGTTHANGLQIGFDKSLNEQDFMRLFSNDCSLRGRQLNVHSNGTVSILWRPRGATLTADSDDTKGLTRASIRELQKQ